MNVHRLPPALRYRRLWLAIGWGLVAFIVWASLTSSPPEIRAEHGDKIGHLLAYGSTMAWFAQVCAGRGTRAGIALALVLLGVALEFAQAMTGYRSFDQADMVADAIGVAIGWLAAPPRFPPLLARIDAALAAR